MERNAQFGKLSGEWKMWRFFSYLKYDWQLSVKCTAWGKIFQSALSILILDEKSINTTLIISGWLTTRVKIQYCQKVLSSIFADF